MSTNLAKFTPPSGSQILLYVNDILVCSKAEKQGKEDTLALLCYLAAQGQKASKNELQLWKRQIRYLGYNLSGESGTLDDSRKQAILAALRPVTKRQMMSFLGMTKFCRSWILDPLTTLI